MADPARKRTPAGLLLILAGACFNPCIAHAGTYVYADGDHPDRIIHPSGYIGSGGQLDVEVCIDANAADALAIEIPIRNIVEKINSMTAATPNLFFGADNNIPSNAIDFESLALHELGHCTGLGHPNLADAVSNADSNYTASGDGADNTFDLNSGVDGVIGSDDDQRGDDQNIHWFRKGVNNPFIEVPAPDASNYSRDPAYLPVNDVFAANADRDVGALLGFADTESVMQQGQYYDEAQRSLQADDVATYRMAMTGLDETANTADDYTINMVYGGIKANTSGCDIVIKSSTSGFGLCSSSLKTSDGIHFTITSATFTYNSNFSWFFNDVLDTNCSAGDDDLVFSNTTHNDTRNHQACNSITYGPNYTVGPNGVVTAIAPVIIFGPNTSISGVFSAISAVP